MSAPPMQKKVVGSSCSAYTLDKSLNGGADCGRRSSRLIPNGQVKPINARSSLRQVQLELANHDHETNVLNSKPIPKKLLPTRPSSGELKAQTSTSAVLSRDLITSSQDKELLTARTMSSLSVDRRSNGTPDRKSNGMPDSGRQVRCSDVPTRRSPLSINVNDDSRLPCNGPKSLSAGRALWGKVRQQYAPTAVELADQPPLPKLATFANLWKTIFDTVRDNDMLSLEEPDPKNWWRKVFLNVKKRHGKGELSNYFYHCDFFAEVKVKWKPKSRRLTSPAMVMFLLTADSMPEDIGVATGTC